MIVLVTMKSEKMMGSKQGYCITYENRDEFASKKEARAFLKEKYGKNKKQKMYINEGTHIGYVYKFKTKMSSNGRMVLHEDWVSFYEETVKQTSPLGD